MSPLRDSIVSSSEAELRGRIARSYDRQYFNLNQVCNMLKREEIRIRDPFIYTDTENGCYYMYGTTALVAGSGSAGNTFSLSSSSSDFPPIT